MNFKTNTLLAIIIKINVLFCYFFYMFMFFSSSSVHVRIYVYKCSPTNNFDVCNGQSEVTIFTADKRQAL